MNNNQFIADLVVIIPAYNEEKTIGKLVSKIKNICDVIVIDDCSNDNTKKMASSKGAIVYTNPQNKGYSYSINIGLKRVLNSKYRYAVTIDADGQHNYLDILKFHKMLKKFDMVCGNRNFKQRIGEKIGSLITKYLFKINDPLCGFKGYNLDKFFFLKNIPFENYNLVGMELLFIALNNKFSVSQISVKCTQRLDLNRFGDGFVINLNIIIAILKGINLKN